MDETLMTVRGVSIIDYSVRMATHRQLAENGDEGPEPDPNDDVELWFVVGDWRHTVMLPVEVFEASKETPVIVREDDGLFFWFIDNRVWATDQRLTPRDVIWHLNKGLRDLMEKGRAMQMKYRPIGMDVIKPWNSDPGGCDECGSVAILKPGQVFPGSSEGTAWNVQFLCVECKGRKEAGNG